MARDDSPGSFPFAIPLGFPPEDEEDNCRPLDQSGSTPLFFKRATTVDLDALTIPELRAIYTDTSFSSGLVDPSGEQLAEYYARVIGWYVRGGFTDENGRFHRSGHNFELPWMEILNEVQWVLPPEQYVVLYDTIVSAIRKVSPSTRFIGLGLGPLGLAGSEGPARDSNIKYFEYFLNPQNHRPGVPLDMVSYHFYAVPAFGQTIASW